MNYAHLTKFCDFLCLIRGDAKILNEVQDRFDVNITELPDEIDLSSYSKCQKQKMPKRNNKNDCNFDTIDFNPFIFSTIFFSRRTINHKTVLVRIKKNV